MDKNLMLSWLATQSQNAAVTPTDIYRAKLGTINEIAFAKSNADTEHARVQGLIAAASQVSKKAAIEGERAKRQAQFGGSTPDSIKESRSRGPDGYKGDRTGNEGT